MMAPIKQGIFVKSEKNSQFFVSRLSRLRKCLPLANIYGVPAYRTGDRCGFCGGTSFYIGRLSAQCSNVRCENVIELSRS
jgi:hypothetical protein